MIPAAFEYERAESVDHAITLLSGDLDAKILAGGHSLLPLMKVRFAQPCATVAPRRRCSTCSRWTITSRPRWRTAASR